MSRTVAELRKNEVVRLAKYKNENPTVNDLQKAKSIMNSFYRLCGLEEKLLYINNDYDTYNFYHKTGMLREIEDKEDRWIKRMKNYLKDYGLTIQYFGYLPTITDENGNTKIYSFFYN